MNNETIAFIKNRKSIRKFKTQCPSTEEIEAIVGAGRQAPFVGQFTTVLLAKNDERAPFAAPLHFIVCIDAHKLEVIMKKRGWKMVTNDLSLLIFGLQDAVMSAENMVIAAEAIGLGSCYVGNTPYTAERFAREFKLPKRVFPLVQLVMGYPDEEPPVRPRYPLNYFLFENQYPKFDDATIEGAMKAMDEGYLEQDYYKRANYKVPIDENRRDKFDFKTYSWTEHMSRKWGQWHQSADKLLDQLEKCGFNLRFGKTSRQDD